VPHARDTLIRLFAPYPLTSHPPPVACRPTPLYTECSGGTQMQESRQTLDDLKERIAHVLRRL